MAEQAAREAIASEVDIVVGLLFTASVRRARPILAASSVPVLALSNNISSASPGTVLGYLSEQQLDHLLGYAVSQNKTRVAILALKMHLVSRSSVMRQLVCRTWSATAADHVIITSHPLMRIV